MWLFVVSSLVGAAPSIQCATEQASRTLQLSDGSTTVSCVNSRGVPEGPMWNTAVDGRLRWLERYDNGRPTGLWERYTKTGVLLERRHYQDGVLSGAWERWYSDGRRRLVGEMVKGRKQGEFRGWHRSGRPAFIARFERGRSDADWQLYSREGRLQSRCRYEGGRRVKSELLAQKRSLERVHVVERLSELKVPVRFCYERELSQRPELARGGEIDFALAVTPAGLTSEVHLVRSTLEAPRVEQCIADTIEQLQFPQLVTCELVEVVFPFVLSPRDS